MERKCANCRNCEVFYTLGYCEYLRSDYGYCCEHKKVVLKTENCENWKGRPTAMKRNPKRVVRELEKALTDIAVLRQIFDTEDPNRW